jgi:hypothetical protein
MLAGEDPVSLIKGECQCPETPRGDFSSLATVHISKTYYVRLPCAPQRTCRAWSIDFIRPKMALSGHTKTAFVRGLGMSACYLDINARAIEDPQVYGVLEWVSARLQVLSI